MRSTLYLRQLGLAALAGLAAVAVLAHEARRDRPAALPPARSYSSALAGAAAEGAAEALSACGVRIGADTEGVVNPVLPCGLRLYFRYRGRTVLASVVAHAPVPAGREFELTAPLAHELGLAGVRRVAWSLAG